MKRLGLLIIGVLVGALLAPHAASAAGSTPKRMILIVAGQSNASGLNSFATDPTTGIDYLAPPYTTAADKDDLIAWWQIGLTHDLQSTPVPLDTPQIVASSPPAQIFGPEIGLARAVMAATKRPVTIVKVACGGTSLAGQWVPGGPLWTNMTAFVRSIIRSDAAKGQTDVIGGFYWVQGENDAVYPTQANAYRANLEKFVTQLRIQLPMASAPIVLGKIWTTLSVVGSNKVRAADNYVAAHEKHVYTVDTKNLGRYDHGVHLTNRSELTLGEEMAKVAMP